MAARYKHGDDVVVLAHNYQPPAIQDQADYIGDSLYLSMKARDLDCDKIIFCGVDFMAESAKILSPEKTVIHPNPDSVCPMAHMVDTEGLLKMKEEHPDAAVVSYVNTTAETKAVSDYCCTSANAVKVVEAIPEKEIIFVPDMNLGSYVQRFTDKKIHLWPGYCPTHHNNITVDAILRKKEEHPDALVLVHPECRPEVVDMADFVGSTEAILNHAKYSPRDEFIIGTERDMTYRLRTYMPHKTFHALEEAICPNMKKITYENFKRSLRSLRPEIELDPELMKRALVPLNRMVEIGRD